MCLVGANAITLSGVDSDYVTEGDEVIYECKAEGANPAVHIIWYNDTDVIEDFTEDIDEKVSNTITDVTKDPQ